MFSSPVSIRLVPPRVVAPLLRNSLTAVIFGSSTAPIGYGRW